MPNSDSIEIRTDFPDYIFKIAATANSQFDNLPDGRISLYGKIDFTLFGVSSILRVWPIDGIVLSRPEAGTGIRTFESVGRFASRQPILRENVADGPSLLIREWSLRKKAGESTTIKLDKFAIWLCSEQIGNSAPDTQTLSLLLPGVGIKSGQEDHWAYGKDAGYVLQQENGQWCVEIIGKLYAKQEDPKITFRPPQIAVAQQLLLYLHRRNAGATRLRLHIGADGLPLGLLVDEPRSQAPVYPLRLVIPKSWSLDVTSSIYAPEEAPVETIEVPIEKIWIAAGKCEARLHRDARVTIGLGPCASISAAGPQFRFLAKLPIGEPDTTPCLGGAIEFGPAPSESSMQDERFDGLRIAGLDSTGRKQEVLEAHRLSLALQFHQGYENNRTAPLIALESDWLGPRPNQYSHDAKLGILDLPVEASLMRIERSGALHVGETSPLHYLLDLLPSREWKGELIINAARLLVPPLGNTAQSTEPGSDREGGDWTAYLVKNLPPSKSIKASQSSAQPKLWLQEDWFAGWELGEPRDFILHDQSELGIAFASVEFKKKPVPVPRVAKTDTGLAYAALALTLAYIAAEYRGQEWEKFFHTELHLALEESDLAKWATSNGLNDLLLVLGRLATDAAQQKWFKTFVNANQSPPEPGNSYKGVIWPFAPGLGIPLYEQMSPSKEMWLWEMRRQGKLRICGFAFDYSAIDRLAPQSLGQDPNFFTEEPRLRPHLWIKSREELPGVMPGAAMDPAFKPWEGVFIADAPLSLAVDVPDGATLLRALKDRINAGLVLKYGWLDADGHTWVAEWAGDTSTPIYPPSSVVGQTPPFRIYMKSFESTGSRGEMLTAMLWMTLQLNMITKTVMGKEVPAELSAKAMLGLAGGQSNLFEATPDDQSAFDTQALPGFDRIAFQRFRTDFKTAALEVTLVPSAELRQALPFFDQNELNAGIALAVSGESSALAFSVLLPAEAPTRLFDKWPVGIRGFEFIFGKDAHANETRVFFALDLGMPGLKRLGGTLGIRRDRADLKFSVSLEALDFDIQAMGLGMKGSLFWQDETHDALDPAGELDVLIADANARDFYGAVRLTGIAETDEKALYLRISSGVRPFWVAALLARSGPPRVANAQVRDAGFLLAYGAEPGVDADALRRVLAAPETLDKTLFPTAGENPVPWLKTWKPASDGTGLAIGMKGTFGLDDLIAREAGSDNLTVLWADTGLFYGETLLKVIYELPARLRLLVDFKRQYFNASLQLPGGPIGGGVTVSPGLLSISIGWGETTGIGLSLGYPPTMEGLSGLAIPDWSKAIGVHIKQAWPINTYQGGVKAYYFSRPKESFGFGVAIRAGYSNSFQATGSDIADARAYVEVMVGGTFQFCRNPVGISSSRPLSLELARGRTDMEWLIEELNALRDVEAQSAPLLISAAIIGDVKGHAAVIFMGVQLAGVRIDASAHFKVQGDLEDGISNMRATFTFQVVVDIGCDTFEATAYFEIVMINRGEKPSADCNNLLRPFRDRALSRS